MKRFKGKLMRSLAIFSLFLFAAGTVTAQGLPASYSRISKVVVVFKTHFDIGFTECVDKVVESYRTTMIDHALDVMGQATGPCPPCWTVPGWPMAQILYPGQTPQRRARVMEALQRGQLAIHALPFTMHTESLELEELVRGLWYSSDLARQLGQPLPRDAKMTDVPEHSWIIPTLCRHAGIEFLHLGCNGGSAPPRVPLLFWWEGPDGSRLLTMYSEGGYGTELTPPPDWPFQTWLALIHTGDNQGPPTPDELQALEEQARTWMPQADVQFGRMQDFADAILAEKPELPVVRADMPDTWIHGIMSMPRETQLARTIRPRIGAAEALNTLLRQWKVPVGDAGESIHAAYAGSLLYGEHTWGSCIKEFGWHYGPKWEALMQTEHYEDMVSQFEDHGDYIRDTRAAVAPVLAENLGALAGAVNVSGRRMVVFNPLPWRRDGLVAVDVPGTFQAVRDEAGEVHPVSWRGARVQFLARDLPPLGYRTYVPADNPARDDGPVADAVAGTLENAYFRVTVDPARGGVQSIVDKRTGREWARAQGDGAVGQYLYEQYDNDDNMRYIDAYCGNRGGRAMVFAKPNLPPSSEKRHRTASPQAWTTAYEADAVRASATLTAGASEEVPHGISLTVSLYRACPYIDLEISILDKQPESWPEAGWLCLPFAAGKPSFLLGRLGSVVNPATDIVEGSNHDVFCLDSGMTIRDEADGAMVGLCPLDSPLISIGKRGLFSYEPKWLPRTATVYVNLFNNQWGCNFQQWCEGTWSSRVRLWFPQEQGAEPSLITPGWEARSEALAAYVDGPAGALPPTAPGIVLSRRGVLLTALGANPDGAGTVLRLWEQAGTGGPLRVAFPETPGLLADTPHLADLRGRALNEEPLSVSKKAVVLNMKPFAPVSLILPEHAN